MISPTSPPSSSDRRRSSSSAAVSAVSSAEEDERLDASLARPDGLAGLPIDMMDYYADCEDAGNPTVLNIKIATTFRNAAAGSNVSFSLRWTPLTPGPPHPRHLWDRLSGAVASLLGSASPAAPTTLPDTVPYSAANLPRMSLIGHFEPITPDETSYADLASCFVNTHSDAKYWLPGNVIHQSSWARLVVEQVYWVGGFGDRAYIGWLPIEDWRGVTREEWESIKLPGEERDWKEWALEEPKEWDL
ncbi:unnamed protein product [Parascedosporium putredinis]|uniref:CREG-like beta-barrel domain-containing protein n=1 Tax=Parascedosporium putredinis TaxID=1442378 RepID=A0A9P1GVN7_9PEZI|nr:unnamed protein product [Parascedosporium putredinis]CAI7988188.1 unnamed protein product [Parascedosporium putredinis]